MASWQTKLKEWAGRAYTVFEDLEPIVEELQPYFPNRLVFDQNRQFILEIIVSGLSDEIQAMYQLVKENSSKKSKVLESVKEKRILWNTKIRPRIFRMIDTLGDLMYGRLVRSREEMEAELEEQRKKQRKEETPSVITSAIDDMAIEDNSKPSGDKAMVSKDKQPVAKGVVPPPPNSMTYDLSDPAERDRYRSDVDAYIRANPKNPPPHPVPDVLMPKIDEIDSTNEEKTEEFKKQCFSWNQEAMEINGTFGANLPLFDEHGNPYEDTSSQALFKRDDGMSSITQYSEDEGGMMEELITDDEDPDHVVLVKTKTETKKFKKGDIKIPKRFLKGETVVTFNGMRSNSAIVIAEQEDYYATPENTTALILKYLEKYHSDHVIWDCCDGSGEMSSVLKESGFKVECTDLYTKQNPVDRLDYLCDSPPFHYDVLVCNPPFSKKHDFLDRAMRIGKPFIMLLPTNTLARRRTVSAFKKGFFKLGLIVPAPKFIPKNFDGTPKEFVEKKGEKVPKPRQVGDCLWLFGYGSANDDMTVGSKFSVHDDFTLTKGVVGLSLLTDVRSIIEYCV